MIAVGDLLLLGLAAVAAVAGVLLAAVLIFWTSAVWAQVAVAGMLTVVVLACIAAGAFVAGKGSAQ